MILPIVLGIVESVSGVDEYSVEQVRRRRRRAKSDKDGGGGDCTDLTCPLETDPGSCLSYDKVWEMYPEIQAEITRDEFRMECGEGGSCFAGETQGCCRFTTGQGLKVGPYVCDSNGYNYPAAAVSMVCLFVVYFLQMNLSTTWSYDSVSVMNLQKTREPTLHPIHLEFQFQLPRLLTRKIAAKSMKQAT